MPPIPQTDAARVPPERSRPRDRHSSTADGFCFSVMVGAGETYLPAFALVLGASDVTAGFLATAPMLAGAIVQLASPLGVQWLGSHRRWVVTCAALQALSFVPLVGAALHGALGPGVVMASAAAYWAFGMATGPAWNTWIETLIPALERPRYFAHRARVAQLGLLIGLVGAGLLLDRAEADGWMLRAFAALFAASLVFRAASTVFLARQSEPVPIPPGFRRYTRGGLMRAGASRRLLLHLLAFQASVWIAAPFFTPYMLGPLGLDAGRYMVLLAVAFLARIAAYPILGHTLGRVGPGRMLLVAGLGIVPLAWLWTVSDAFGYLVALQVLAGFVWGAHELAVLILFFETIERAHRTAVLTLYNVANAAAMAGGTAIGAVLLGHFGNDAAGYALVLTASSGARAVSMLWVPGIRTVVTGAVVPAIRTLAARPGVGGVDRPVLGSLDPTPVGAPGPDRTPERRDADPEPRASDPERPRA